MKNQLFKKTIPTTILIDFLKKYADDMGNYYIFSSICYNRAKFHNEIQKFCDEIEDYYHTSKKHYVTKKMSFNGFTTIIRQICKSNLITYTSKVNYRQSTYDIIYYIYKDELQKL